MKKMHGGGGGDRMEVDNLEQGQDEPNAVRGGGGYGGNGGGMYRNNRDKGAS